MATLLGSYAFLEKQIQETVGKICIQFCRKCRSKCCREEICRESVESSFLSSLVEQQEIRYDPQKGWISPLGCRLSYGRPPVCYEFFCEGISKSEMFQAANIRKIAHEFVSVGNKARGKTHLICIDNLDLLSATKMDKMISKIKGMAVKLANPGFHSKP